MRRGVPCVGVGPQVAGGVGGGDAPAGLLQVLLETTLQQLLSAGVVEVVAVDAAQSLQRRQIEITTAGTMKLDNLQQGTFQFRAPLLPEHNARRPLPSRPPWPSASLSAGTCRPVCKQGVNFVTNGD